MKLRWTQRARQDLLGIGRYIALDKPKAARQWVARLRKAALLSCDFPLSGRRVPELDRNDIREILVRRYRIVYQVLDDEIHVLTVFEGHRLFPQDVLDSVE